MKNNGKKVHLIPLLADHVTPRTDDLRRLIPSEVKKLKNVLKLNHLILSHSIKEVRLLSENFEDSFHLGEIDVVNKSHLNCYI